MDTAKIKKSLETLVIPDAIDGPTNPTVFVDSDNMLCVSGEDGKCLIDYYGEFRGGFPYIDPTLEAWAEENNGYWEWQNPGAIVFVER